MYTIIYKAESISKSGPLSIFGPFPDSDLILAALPEVHVRAEALHRLDFEGAAQVRGVGPTRR